MHGRYVRRRSLKVDLPAAVLAAAHGPCPCPDRPTHSMHENDTIPGVRPAADDPPGNAHIAPVVRAISLKIVVYLLSAIEQVAVAAVENNNRSIDALR